MLWSKDTISLNFETQFFVLYWGTTSNRSHSSRLTLSSEVQCERLNKSYSQFIELADQQLKVSEISLQGALISQIYETNIYKTKYMRQLADQQLKVSEFIYKVH